MPIAENLSWRKRETVTETEFYSMNVLVVVGLRKCWLISFCCWYFFVLLTTLFTPLKTIGTSFPVLYMKFAEENYRISLIVTEIRPYVRKSEQISTVPLDALGMCEY